MTPAEGARFRINSKGYYHRTCMACEAKRSREYAAAHRLQRRAYKQVWRARNKERRSPATEGKTHTETRQRSRDSAPAPPKAPKPTPDPAPPMTVCGGEGDHAGVLPRTAPPTLRERLKAKRAAEQEHKKGQFSGT